MKTELVKGRAGIRIVSDDSDVIEEHANGVRVTPRGIVVPIRVPGSKSLFTHQEATVHSETEKAPEPDLVPDKRKSKSKAVNKASAPVAQEQDTVMTKVTVMLSGATFTVEYSEVIADTACMVLAGKEPLPYTPQLFSMEQGGPVIRLKFADKTYNCAYTGIHFNKDGMTYLVLLYIGDNDEEMQQ